MYKGRKRIEVNNFEQVYNEWKDSKITAVKAMDKLGITQHVEIEKVIKINGVMSNAQCQKNNPLGRCCHQIIQDAIDKGLSMK